MKCFLIIGAILSLTPGLASSCSPWQEQAFQVAAKPMTGELVPTSPPAARVLEISRGRKAMRGEDSCSELASVSIAVRDDSPGIPYVFSFEQVAGAAPDEIFVSGLYAGASNGNGEQVFHFHWPELEAPPKPFEVTVKITPHSRSGTAGPSAMLVVSDGF